VLSPAAALAQRDASKSSLTQYKSYLHSLFMFVAAGGGGRAPDPAGAGVHGRRPRAEPRGAERRRPAAGGARPLLLPRHVQGDCPCPLPQRGQGAYAAAAPSQETILNVDSWIYSAPGARRPAPGCRRSSPAPLPTTCARCFRGQQFAMLPNHLRPLLGVIVF